MKAFALIALLSCASACSALAEKPAPDYWLFSWLMRDGAYRFVVIPERERDAFVDGFRPSVPGHGNVAHVTAQLRTLPRGAVVGWGDATCSGLIYPPKDIMRPIERFAFDHGINLIVLPGQCKEH